MLTVQTVNDRGAVSDTHQITITDIPITGLTATNDSPTLLGEVTALSAMVTGGTNIVYIWDFGDDSSGSGQVVTHTYAVAGDYTATVTATNTANSLSATTVVTISAPTYWQYLPFNVKAEPATQAGHVPAPGERLAWLGAGIVMCLVCGKANGRKGGKAPF